MHLTLTVASLAILLALGAGEELGDSGRTITLIFSEEGRKVLKCLGTFAFTCRTTEDAAIKMEKQGILCECLKKTVN